MRVSTGGDNEKGAVDYTTPSSFVCDKSGTLLGMSSFPPPDAPPQEYILQPRRPVWPSVVSWIVILLCVAFIVLGQYVPEILGRKRAASAGPMQEAQLEFVARYAVGANHLLKSLAPAATTAKSSTTAATAPSDPAVQIAQIMGKQAKGPLDEFHSAITSGELLGREAALKQLDAIKPEPDSNAKPDREDLATVKMIYSAGGEKIDAEARSRLIDRHGFFGKLAVSFGRSDSDPTRAGVLAKAAMTFVGVIAFFMVMGVFLLAGVVLLTLGIVKLASRRVTLAGTAPDVPGGPFVEAFALYLVIYIALSFALGFLKVQSLSASLALIVLMPLALLWPMLRGLPASDCRRALGWNVGRGFFREVGWGLVGYVSGIPIVALGFAATFVLMKLSKSQPTHPLVAEVGKMSPLVIYALACVVAPLLEETMFRGALLHHLRTRWNWLISAVVVSLIFAMIHPQGLTFIPTLGAIAMVLAALREWRGSLIASIVAHAMTNFITATLLIFALS
jgi:membrane protease YdiL (CAAX protease family)